LIDLSESVDLSESISCYKLRKFWRDIATKVGITKRVVPHQLRQSVGTEMLRAGVSFPAVMKLLGHLTPEMTMRYVEVCLPALTARVPSGSLLPPPSGARITVPLPLPETIAFH
jgi:site-specific recombinase XerD